MKRLNKTVLALATAGVLSSGVAQAALFDRGGGLIYDDVLKITWLSDANYAATQYAATGGTQGDADGLMNWTAANSWAASLDISRFAGESLTGWRLPTALNQDGSGPCFTGYDCSSSEMGYMFYNNMGAIAPNSILTGTNTANLALFTNLQFNDPNIYTYVYWFGTAYAPSPADDAWVFNTGTGGQGPISQRFEFNSWAVRPGDVAAVPEPEAYALLMAGLGLLGVVAKRRRRTFAAL